MEYTEIVRVESQLNSTRDFNLVVCKSPKQVMEVLNAARGKGLKAKIIDGSVIMASEQLQIWKEN